MPRIYPEEVKQKAIELRKQGLSYSEIQKLFNPPIPKNTFTNWFKHILLSEKAKERIAQKIKAGGAPGRAVAWKNTQRRRVELLNSSRINAEAQVGLIDNAVGKIILATLYLAEGGKTNEWIRFGNSDPKIIKVFLALLRKTCSIQEEKLKAKVQCRADQGIKELEKFWSEISGIPLSNFHKGFIDKRTLGKPTEKKEYKGVFVVEYYSNTLFLELKFISDIIFEKITNIGPVV